MNEPLNFLRVATPACHEWLKKNGHQVPEYSEKAYAILDEAKRAVKFILPDNGRIFGDKLRGLPSDFRLLYPSILIEYVCKAEGGLAEAHFGKEQTHNAPERIILAQQDGDSVLVVSVICMHIGSTRQWYVQPFVAEIIPTGSMNVLERGHVQVVSVEHEQIDQVAVVMHDLGGMAVRQFGLKWEDHAYYDMNDECNAVLELIEALSCSNVGSEALPVRKANKSSLKRGALPFDEYRVLMIRASGAAGGGVVSLSDRRQSREHLRRGHVRRLQDGRRVWVNATVVNAGAVASVHKAYRVAA